MMLFESIEDVTWVSNKKNKTFDWSQDCNKGYIFKKEKEKTPLQSLDRELYLVWFMRPLGARVLCVGAHRTHEKRTEGTNRIASY